MPFLPWLIHRRGVHYLSKFYKSFILIRISFAQCYCISFARFKISGGLIVSCSLQENQNSKLRADVAGIKKAVDA